MMIEVAYVNFVSSLVENDRRFRHTPASVDHLIIEISNLLNLLNPTLYWVGCMVSSIGYLEKAYMKF